MELTCKRKAKKEPRMDMAGQDGLNAAWKTRLGTFIFISKENPIRGILNRVVTCSDLIINKSTWHTEFI